MIFKFIAECQGKSCACKNCKCDSSCPCVAAKQSQRKDAIASASNEPTPKK